MDWRVANYIKIIIFLLIKNESVLILLLYDMIHEIIYDSTIKMRMCAKKLELKILIFYRMTDIFPIFEIFKKKIKNLIYRPFSNMYKY